MRRVEILPKLLQQLPKNSLISFGYNVQQMGTSQVLLTSSHSAIFDSIQVFSSKAQPLTMHKNPFLQIVPQRIVFVIGSHRILLDPI